MQIQEEIKQCVVFLGYKSKKTNEICLTGTGFFVQVKNQVFLVTAKHIIAKVQTSGLSEDNQIWIRLNKQNAGIEFIAYNLTDFASHPNTDISTDVVILPIEKDLDQKIYE